MIENKLYIGNFEKKGKELWVHQEGYTCPVFIIPSNNRKETALRDAKMIVELVNQKLQKETI